MIIDFHTHGKLAKYLAFSPDYTDWLFASARRAGLDALCLTEHFNTQGFHQVYADISSRYPRVGDAFDVNGLLVFPGMEVDIAESGHTLVLGPMEDILEFNRALEPHKAKGAFLSFDELADETERRGLHFGAGHPFRAPSRIPELTCDQLRRFEFVDLNGKDLSANRTRTIERTYAFAQRIGGVPVVSGSDTHQAFQYGCVVTRMECACTTFDRLFEQVHERAYQIEFADDLEFRVLTAATLKRALKEIDRLGGSYVETILAGPAA